MKGKDRKWLFIGLSWLAFLIVNALLLLSIYLVYPRLQSIAAPLTLALWIGYGLIFAAVGGGLLLISLTAITGIDLLYPHDGVSITMRVLFPVVLGLGTVLGFDALRLMEAFVETNNSLVWAQRKRLSTERVLMLLPHCLQHHECQWRITFDISNCRRCGKCDIASLAELSDRFGIAVRVATGGTLARKVVKDYRPTVILAVACGRDLSSGIIDSHPIPVFGVLNERPNGPCFDTKVDVDRVEEILTEMMPEKSRHTETNNIKDLEKTYENPNYCQ